VRREIWEITAPTVNEAKARARELFNGNEGGDIHFVVLDGGSGNQGYSSIRRPARVRAEWRAEGFGRVEREWPESIPAPPPEPQHDEVKRMIPTQRRSEGRSFPKPELVLTETPPAPKVTQLGIEPSHARPREEYHPTPEDDRLVEEVVEELLTALGIPCEARYEHADYQRIFIAVGEKDAGSLIGRHGAGVDALEHLLGRMISQRCGSHVPVQVDVNDYRAREEERLREDAREAAEEARRTGDEIHFDPMNPRERRIVHLAVQDIPGIETYTVGEGRHRHVVMVYAEDGGENKSQETK